MHPEIQRLLVKAHQDELLAEARRDRLAREVRSAHTDAGRPSDSAMRLRGVAVAMVAVVLLTRGIEALGR